MIDEKKSLSSVDGSYQSNDGQREGMKDSTGGKPLSLYLYAQLFLFVH